MARIIREELAESIGRELKRLREEVHRMSPKELHSESGVPTSTIMLIESGHAVASSGTLMRLLKAMNEEELSI